MNKYLIVTDSTCDLDITIIHQFDIKVIPMEFTIDDQIYLHEYDFKTFNEIDFYNKLRNGSKASTSQITPYTYEEYLTTYLKAGYDILYISFSSGLSGTYESAVIAFDGLRSVYPNQKLVVIDSLAASAGEGLMVYYACLNREQGMSLEANSEWLSNHVQSFAHWVYMDDLHHLKRGGRISATTAFVGSALSVKPIIHVDKEGKLVQVQKAHGKKKAIKFLFNKFIENALDPSKQTVMIAHGDSLDEAEKLAVMLKEEAHVKDVIISTIGPVIGAHSGPGTIAFFYLATNRD